MQVCGEMLYSVSVDGPRQRGGICKERPRRPDQVAAALAVLCGRPLFAVVRQLSPNDTRDARKNLKEGTNIRCSQLTKLEAALACMADVDQQKHWQAAVAAVAVASASVSTGVAAAANVARQPRSCKKEDAEPQSLTLSEFEKLLPIERARRNFARLLFDHPNVGGLVISISDVSFTYFEWGNPEEGDEEDTTPTRWYAEVR